MRALVRSGQGRLHLAAQAPDGGWVGLCGCVLVRGAQAGAYDVRAVLDDAAGCRYCVAICRAVSRERERALETLQDTLQESIQLEHDGRRVA